MLGNILTLGRIFLKEILNFNGVCLYSVPEWSKNKKAYKFVESKFGDTFKRIRDKLFDNGCLIIKYLSNEDDLGRGKTKVPFVTCELNFYTFNKK